MLGGDDLLLDSDDEAAGGAFGEASLDYYYGAEAEPEPEVAVAAAAGAPDAEEAERQRLLGHLSEQQAKRVAKALTAEGASNSGSKRQPQATVARGRKANIRFTKRSEKEEVAEEAAAEEPAEAAAQEGPSSTDINTLLEELDNLGQA